MIKSKPKMIVAFLLMSAILMMSIQTSMATEKDIMSNDVIKQAFDNNVNKISCIPETIETIEVHVNLQLGEHILWQELRLYRYHDIWLWGGVHMSTKNNKLRFIDEEKTKELQKDWKGYGKSQVLFGIVVFVIFVLSALYYYIL